MSNFENSLKNKKDARNVLIPVNQKKEDEEILNSNTVTEVEKEIEVHSGSIGEKSIESLSDLKESVLSKYEERRKKPTIEETHIRTTFLLEKTTAKRLDKLTRGKRGMKTMVMNDAIKALLDAMEGK